MSEHYVDVNEFVYDKWVSDFDCPHCEIKCLVIPDDVIQKSDEFSMMEKDCRWWYCPKCTKFYSSWLGPREEE